MGRGHRNLEPHIARLTGLDIFADCTTQQLRWIDRLGTTVDMPRNRVLCRQGGIAREAFVVTRGVATATTDLRPIYIIGRAD